MTSKATKIRRNTAIDEIRRWASVVLIILVFVLGYYVHQAEAASNKAAAASSTAADASNRAADASNRAADAAGKASSDLAAAIAASNNPDQAAAILRALRQIDDIERILCVEHAAACQQVIGPGG